MVYKISIVVTGADHGGAIINSPHKPEVGDRLRVGDMEVEVVELTELIPPRGEFHFLHATCKPITTS